MDNSRFKFKAWDFKNKRIVGIDSIEFFDFLEGRTGANVFVISDNKKERQYWLESSEYELLQYTGLKDKNGKEIYEGDILQCYYGGDKIGAKEIVEFQNGAFWLRYRNVTIPQWLEDDGVYSSEIEVIGNIYQNPKLLSSVH